MLSKNPYICNISSLSEIKSFLIERFDLNSNFYYAHLVSYLKKEGYRDYHIDPDKYYFSQFFVHVLLRIINHPIPRELQNYLSFYVSEVNDLDIKRELGYKKFDDIIQLKITLNSNLTDAGRQKFREFYNRLKEKLESHSSYPSSLLFCATPGHNTVLLLAANPIIRNFFGNALFLAIFLINHASEIKDSRFIVSACKELLGEVSFFSDLPDGIPAEGIKLIKQNLQSLHNNLRKKYNLDVPNISNLIKNEKTIDIEGLLVKQIEFNSEAKNKSMEINDYLNYYRDAVYKLIFYGDIENRFIKEVIDNVLENGLTVYGLSVINGCLTDEAVGDIVKLIDKTALSTLTLTPKDTSKSISIKEIPKIVTALGSNYSITRLCLDNNSGYTAELKSFINVLIEKNAVFKKLSTQKQNITEEELDKLSSKVNENNTELSYLKREFDSITQAKEKLLTEIKELNLKQDEYGELLKKDFEMQKDYKQWQLQFEENHTSIEHLKRDINELDQSFCKLNIENQDLKTEVRNYQYAGTAGYDLTVEELTHEKNMIQFKCLPEGFSYTLDNNLKTGLIPWRKLPNDFPQNEKDILANKGKLLSHILKITSTAGHTARPSNNFERLIKAQTYCRIFLSKNLKEKKQQIRCDKIKTEIERIKDEMKQAKKCGDLKKISQSALLLKQLNDLVQQHKLHEAIKKITKKPDIEYKNCIPGKTIRY